MKSSLNRIFKVIWSKVQMAWVAVSEAATAHGKQQSMTRITRTIKLDNDEKIELEINTRQNLAFVSVPLYAGYRLGEGRLKFLLKGGVLLNFLRANDFEIAGIKQGNGKFAFQPKNQPMGNPQDLQTVSVDFVAGLGLDFSLTKSLSLRLEPTVSGSLTSLHNSPYIQSSQYSAGLNAGVMYNF